MNTIDITRFTPIPSEEGYMIDKNGFVLSLKKKTPKVLRPRFDSRTGYYKVGVNHHKTRSVHSLVAETFLGNRPNGYDIDHKDGNKLNNSVENLHYVLRKENQSNPNNHGKNYWQLYTNRGVIATKNGIDQLFSNCREMAMKLHLSRSAVSSVINQKAKHHKGYTFRWAS
jgi:hypothetical protein